MSAEEVRVETLKKGDKISVLGTIATVTSIRVNPPREGYKKGFVVLRLKYPDGIVKTGYIAGTYVQLNV